MFDFVANGNDVLTFTDLTDSSNRPGPDSTRAGLALDNVSVTESVPDPGGTLVLMVSALMGLGVARPKSDG